MNKKEQDNKNLETVLKLLLTADLLYVMDGIKNDHIWTVNKDTVGYEQIIDGINKRLNSLKTNESSIPSFVDYVRKDGHLEYLNESENMEVDRWLNIFENEHSGELDENFLTKLIGGAAGFIVGPTIGRVIARALGIEKGVLYDLFTSRLVSTALGSAIAKSFGGEYKV